MNNPKCPYCGHEMMYLYEKTKYWFVCELCGASSPLAYTLDEARAAAMKRDRAKGEWIENPIGEYVCNHCSRVVKYYENYCPDCGAEMEANDER